MFSLILEREEGVGEGGRETERERGRQRNIDWLPPVHALTGDQTCNLGLCADRKLNPQPFRVQDDPPTN